MLFVTGSKNDHMTTTTFVALNMSYDGRVRLIAKAWVRFSAGSNLIKKTLNVTCI